MQLFRSARFHCAQATGPHPLPTRQRVREGWADNARLLADTLCEVVCCLSSTWHAWAWTVQVAGPEEVPAARVLAMLGDCPIDVRLQEKSLCPPPHPQHRLQ